MFVPPQLLIGICVIGGALAGYGLYLLAMQFVPVTPALGPALRRLHPEPEQPTPLAVAASPKVKGPSKFGFTLPAQDLDILGRTAERHVVEIIVGAVVAMLIPGMLATTAAILGLSFSWSVPAGLTLIFALLAGVWVHTSMRAQARAARAEFVRALCTYSSLTAHQVRSGHGAVEAMERAARVCQGRPFVRLRHALLTAQLQMVPPWDELKRLADSTGVTELATFADIMRSAGGEGAQVYQTLRAQAGSLRDQIRVKTLEVAKTRSSKLDVPSTLLVIVLLVLFGYPLMLSIF
jgi:pilus assembly protein TadC